jgi:hypothetical protein
MPHNRFSPPPHLWLDSLSDDSDTDFMERLKPRDGLVLYYPGAGTDYGPLQHFAQELDLAVAVYVDYLITPNLIHQMLRSVSPQVPELRCFSPKHLGLRRWADFWPDHEDSRMFARPTRAFGLQCDLQIHPDHTTRLIYLATEGHQTYQNLLGTVLQPDLVVLQDHGFGGNWRDFGGESPMYRMAHAAGALPLWVFSAGLNTQVWPGYEWAGQSLLLPGQMHDYERHLHRRREVNVESEWNDWQTLGIWD